MASPDTGLYKFEHLFGSNLLSDLTVVLTTAIDSVTPAQPPAKRARTREQSSHEVESECQDSQEVLLPGHGVILGGCSPVFMAQLTRWQEQVGSSSNSSNDRPRITIHVSNSTEMEAARAVVQFMYERRLPEDASQTLLLTIMQLADKFDVQPCAVACGSALSKLELDTDALMQVLQLPPSYSESPSFSSLYSKAADQLQQEFGDLEAAWADDQKAERFLALPFKGVELLLADKRTRVAYENTVLAATTVWAEQHDSTLTPQEKKQLAQHIRCPFFTPFFASTVAAATPWFGQALGLPIVLAATGVVAALCSTRTLYKALMAGREDFGWPASWALGERPKSAMKELSAHWCVPLTALERLFTAAQQEPFLRSPRTNFGGYAWQLKVMVLRSDQAESSPTSTLGVYLTCHAISESSSASLATTPAVRVAAASVACLPSNVGPLRKLTFDDSDEPLRAHLFKGCGYGDFWRTGPLSAWNAEKFAAWVDTNGELDLRTTVSRIQ